MFSDRKGGIPARAGDYDVAFYQFWVQRLVYTCAPAMDPAQLRCLAEEPSGDSTCHYLGILNRRGKSIPIRQVDQLGGSDQSVCRSSRSSILWDLAITSLPSSRCPDISAPLENEHTLALPFRTGVLQDGLSALYAGESYAADELLLSEEEGDDDRQ